MELPLFYDTVISRNKYRVNPRNRKEREYVDEPGVQRVELNVVYPRKIRKSPSGLFVDESMAGFFFVPGGVCCAVAAGGVGLMGDVMS